MRTALSQRALAEAISYRETPGDSAATVLLSTTIGGPVWSQAPSVLKGAGERHGHNTHSIFVDVHADPGGDGTEIAPYQTITHAMERAREIRQSNRYKIVVHVAPGEYVEDFPLYINISDIELRGSTRLAEDRHGLPRDCGTDRVAAPCIEADTTTFITSPEPFPLARSLFTVSPTKDRPTAALANITISGFVFDGKGSGSIGIVRANNFLVEHNVMQHSYPGLATSWSSGRVQSNFAYLNNVGLAPGGGSDTYPASVEVIANRSANNGAGGAAFGTANFGFFVDPNLLEIQRTYDAAQQPEEVPDKLVLVLIGNTFTRNTTFGFRFEHYVPFDYFYDTTDNQPMTANITATVHRNTCSDNGEYGFLVEGGFATRTNPRTFRAAFIGSFEANDLSSNGRAGLFVGFLMNGFVTRNPDQINQDKYVQDSQFMMKVDEEGDLFGVDYDNPYFDPYPPDHDTPLNNTLTINGDAVTGTHVTCPPGFTCVTWTPCQIHVYLSAHMVMQHEDITSVRSNHCRRRCYVGV